MSRGSRQVFCSLFARRIALAFAMAALSSVAAMAQDVVYLSKAADPQARSRLAGQVIDYTGSELVIELAGGLEKRYPGRLVVGIEAAWSAPQVAGDRLLSQQQYAAALDQYRQAAKREQRRWVRRKLMADMIACYRGLGEPGPACLLFLALVEEDAQTPYFDQIPLAWLPAEPSPSLAQQSKKWLEQTESPMAVLLGASHLLSTAERPVALDRLRALAAGNDDRVAPLAQAQTWRADFIAAGEGELAQWAGRLDQFPELLRAGPYLLVGRAQAQRRRWEQAALTLLHVPVLYPRERTLAAEALWSAGQALEKLSQPAVAARLYQELVAGYPEARMAAGAQQRLAALAVAAQGGAVPPTATEGPLEERFLAGLRGRQLFELAQSYCRAGLAAAGLDDRRSTELAIELSRSFTEHALHSAPDVREPLWRGAIDALAGLDDRGAGQPLAVLAQVQRGLVRLAHGELARQEAQLVSAGAERLELARDELRAGVVELRGASEAIAAQLRRASQRGRPDPGRLTAVELASLQRNVAYQLARAFRNQGQCYPAGSADRTNSLRQATEILEPLAAGADPDALVWQSRLDEIVCHRLLEDYSAAAARLARFESEQAPPRVALGARAERLRLALDRGRVDEALAVVEQARAEGSQGSADLDYAALEAYLAAARTAAEAHQDSSAAEWQARAVELVHEIDRWYGPYWSRRAEGLLAGIAGSAGGTGNVALMLRAAEGLYRGGQIEQALAAYDQAAEQANEQRQKQAAFDAWFAAAAIQQEQKHHRAAADRYRRLALALPEHAQAGDAHLLAIFNTAQAAKSGDQPPGEQAPVDYLALVEEHLAAWPQAASANQARIWLGRLHEHRRAWTDAVAAYRAVAADHPLFAEAMEAIARSYDSLLTEQRSAGKPTVPAATEAAAYFESLFTAPDGRLPERWSPAQRAAALNAARMWVQFTEHFARAEAILRAALADAQESSDAWQSQAHGLLAVALAGQGQRDEAGRLLDGMVGGSPEQLFLLAESLSRVAAATDSRARREIAELEVQIARRIRPGSQRLSESQRRDLELLFIRALAAAEQRDESLEAARRLAETFPRDGEVQEQYATLLIEGRDEASWQAALKQWRLVGKKSRSGSPRWLRSMYHQALAYERLGDRTRAAQLIRLTQGMHPELGGNEMKGRFAELLERVE